MTIKNTMATAIGALALIGASTLAAQAKECFFSTVGDYPCTFEREADGSVSIDAGDFDQSQFVNTGDGQFERIVYDPVDDRGKVAGIYKLIPTEKQCFINTQFDDDVVCAFD